MLPLRVRVDLGAMAMKGYFAFPKALVASSSDCLVSYLGHSLGECYPFAETQSVYSAVPTDWATGYLLGESYPSAEMQSVYSAAPAGWATGYSLGESYPSAEMQSVNSIAPAGWVRLLVDISASADSIVPISAMWNAIILVQDLNSSRRVHFLRR